MSAAHRSLTRLPLEVYTDLIRGRAHSDVDDNPGELRRKICSKLKKFPTRSRGKHSHDVIHESVTTVGQLLTRISKLTLLRVLDPLLTYGTYYIFILLDSGRHLFFLFSSFVHLRSSLFNLTSHVCILSNVFTTLVQRNAISFCDEWLVPVLQHPKMLLNC